MLSGEKLIGRFIGYMLPRLGGIPSKVGALLLLGHILSYYLSLSFSFIVIQLIQMLIPKTRRFRFTDTMQPN
jgi:hypothetical protein